MSALFLLRCRFTAAALLMFCRICRSSDAESVAVLPDLPQLLPLRRDNFYRRFSVSEIVCKKSTIASPGSCQMDGKGAAGGGNQKNRSREGTTFTDNFLSAKLSVKIQRLRAQDPVKWMVNEQQNEEVRKTGAAKGQLLQIIFCQRKYL